MPNGFAVPLRMTLGVGKHAVATQTGDSKQLNKIQHAFFMVNRNYLQLESTLTQVIAFSNFCFEMTRKKTGGTSNRSCKLQMVF